MNVPNKFDNLKKVAGEYQAGEVEPNVLYGAVTDYIDAVGEAKDGVLTIEQAGRLADLIRAVQAGSKLRYYPYGSDSNVDEPRFTTAILRAFTNQDGTMYPMDTDIRDAYVWTSGIFEHWYLVSDLLAAMENAVTAGQGYDSPMAIIESR